MGTVKLDISMSLDGYIAGPDAERRRLRSGSAGCACTSGCSRWRAGASSTGRTAARRTPSTRPWPRRRCGERRRHGHGPQHVRRRPGAVGRRPPWNGWWGEDPPFHHPVFVLTHHARAPLVDAGRHDVHVRHRRHRLGARAGPGRRGRQGRPHRRRRRRRAAVSPRRAARRDAAARLAGVPRRRRRLFADIPPDSAGLEAERVVASPGVTHLRFRIVR